MGSNEGKLTQGLKNFKVPNIICVCCQSVYEKEEDVTDFEDNDNQNGEQPEKNNLSSVWHSEGGCHNEDTL